MFDLEDARRPGRPGSSRTLEHRRGSCRRSAASTWSSSTTSTRTWSPAAARLRRRSTTPQWKRLVDTTSGVSEVADRPRATAGRSTRTRRRTSSTRTRSSGCSTTPTSVQLCLDVGHHAYCGGEPVAFFERHRDRIPYLHLKSVDRELRERVERRRDARSPTAVAEGVFVEPSVGVVDFAALRDVMAEHRLRRASRSSSRTCTRRRSTGRCRSPSARTSTSELGLMSDCDRRSSSRTRRSTTTTRARPARCARPGSRCCLEPRDGRAPARRGRRVHARRRRGDRLAPTRSTRACFAACRGCACSPASASASTRSTWTPPPRPASR